MNEPESNEPEKLLDVDGVALLLGIHQQTVYQMARSGALRGMRVGRAWRFRPSDVKEWQEARLAEAAS